MQAVIHGGHVSGFKKHIKAGNLSQLWRLSNEKRHSRPWQYSMYRHGELSVLHWRELQLFNLQGRYKMISNHNFKQIDKYLYEIPKILLRADMCVPARFYADPELLKATQGIEVWNNWSLQLPFRELSNTHWPCPISTRAMVFLSEGWWPPKFGDGTASSGEGWLRYQLRRAFAGNSNGKRVE